VFENGVLRTIFRPKRDELTRGGRRLHNKELNDLYSSSNIRVIKSKRMRWAEHVARNEERRGVHRVWWGNLRKRDHLEDPSVDGRIILRIDL